MYCVYILTNPRKSVLYTGVTDNLNRRVRECRRNKGNKKFFANKYFCYKLIYFECFDSKIEALAREKEIKKLSQENKFFMIRVKNPQLVSYLV